MTVIDAILDHEQQLVNAKRALDLEAIDRILCGRPPVDRRARGADVQQERRDG